MSSRRMRASLLCVLRRWRQEPGCDRGDVPGWVLVTVMTAGLVSALWIVADDKLGEMFTAALGSVTGS